jgi:regulator of sigma E protease
MTWLAGLETLTWVEVLMVVTVLVFVHELGHYLVARWNGVRIDVFSIGFGPELFGWNDRTGTRWKFSAIPLGGYVKMFGDENAASLPSGNVSQMTEAEKRVSFPHKRLLQRVAIVSAGPIANFILAIALLTVVITFHGQDYTPPTVGYVVEESAAAAAGIKVGDVVVSIEGQHIGSFEDILNIVPLNTGTPLDVVLRRGGEMLERTITPQIITDTDRLGLKYSIARLGIQPFSPPVVGDVEEKSPAAAAGVKPGDTILSIDGKQVASYQEYLHFFLSNTTGAPVHLALKRGDQVVDIQMTPTMVKIKDPSGVERDLPRVDIYGPKGEVVEHGPVSSIWYATVDSWRQTTGTLRTVGQMLLGRRGADGLGGLISIGGYLHQAAKDGILAVVRLAAFISLNLGLINLFPIPVLDGGWLLFYAAEGIRGKPLGQRAQEYGFRLGLALVLMLMIFANWNDLDRWGIVGFIKRLVT